MKPIKRIFLSLTAAVLLPHLSTAQTLLWAKGTGGPDFDEGRSIAIDTAGNVYTTGYFQGIVDFDPGPGTFNLTSAGMSDVFISKSDVNGNFVWAKAMGGTGSDQGSSIAVDAAGNVYSTGRFQGTADFDPGQGTFPLTAVGSSDQIFLSKLNANGEFVWAKAMGGTFAAESFSIAVDAAKNVYTTGNFRGTVDFDPGPGTFNLTAEGTSDIFLLKLNGDGDFIWAKSFIAAPGSGQGLSIAVDAAENVYSTGHFDDTTDFDPGPGTFHLAPLGVEDIFISKLDPNGDFVWAKAMGGAGSDQGLSIAVDAMGNVYTTGFFRQTVDFDPGANTFNLTSAGREDIFISKLDTNGDFIWAIAMGGTGADFGQSIAVDAAGNVYSTGSFGETADLDPGPGTANFTASGPNDVFLSQLDPDAGFVWAKAFGGSGFDGGASIAVDPPGNVHSTGYFSGTVNFSSEPGIPNLTAVGFGDIFILKISASSTSISPGPDPFPLTIFPNPSTGRIVIEGEPNSQRPVRISVFNSLGQQVMPAREVAPAANWSEEIDLSTQPNGIYHLRVSDGSGSVSRQVMIQR